ncbi:hypothetical protein FZEAL_7658 [Fusarium zealandicum]|uniref:EthD domain-containing protein n=1 Tax=Fusarium zealandicum TaxID=1053134 RepID=A0A8H4UG08_9HYPO|nr:hypothetical protein FZEAL_7658 [Fusarium zealandicum]
MPNTDRFKGHVQIAHDFTLDKFTYDNPVHYQPCIKVAFYFKKREDVSYEHFFTHWAQVHADLTVTCKNFGLFQCQRYIQHHQPPEMREGLLRMGMSPMDFDGCSTLWFKDWPDFQRFFTAPGYQGKLTEDCKHFMDVHGGISAFAGRDVIVFGRGIPGVDDEDGITDYVTGDKRVDGEDTNKAVDSEELTVFN